MTTILKIATESFNLSDHQPFSLKGSFQKIQHVIFTPSFLKTGLPWFLLLCAINGAQSMITLLSEPGLQQRVIGLLISMTDLVIIAGVNVAWYRLLAFQIYRPRIIFSKAERHLLGGQLIIGAFALCLAFVVIGLFASTLNPIPFVIGGLGFFLLMPLVYLFLGLLGIGVSYPAAIANSYGIFKPIFIQLCVGYSILSLFLMGFSVGFLTLLMWMPPFIQSFFQSFMTFFSASIMTIFTSHILYQRCTYHRAEESHSL